MKDSPLVVPGRDKPPKKAQHESLEPVDEVSPWSCQAPGPAYATKSGTWGPSTCLERGLLSGARCRMWFPKAKKINVDSCGVFFTLRAYLCV